MLPNNTKIVGEILFLNNYLLPTTAMAKMRFRIWVVGWFSITLDVESCAK